MRELLWAVTLFPTFLVSLVYIPQFPTWRKIGRIYLLLTQLILVFLKQYSFWSHLSVIFLLCSAGSFWLHQATFCRMFYHTSFLSGFILGSDLADFTICMLFCTLFAQLYHKSLFGFVVAYCLYLVALQCYQSSCTVTCYAYFYALVQRKLWWLNLGCLPDAHQPALLMPPPQQGEKIQ